MSAQEQLARVVQAFARAEIRWCLLRAGTTLSSPDDDVDILVDRADARRIARALKGAGFVRLPAWGRGIHRFFYSYDPSTDCWLKLDIVTDLVFGPDGTLRTRAAAGCLARRQWVGDVAMLAPGDAFWALLLHCLLDKGSVAPHHAARLRELVGAARLDNPLARVAERLYPFAEMGGEVLAAIQAGNWTALTALASVLRRKLPSAWGLPWFGRLARRLDRWHPYWPYRGTSVALLGPDGAGKSTLATSIRETFRLPTRVIYMGRGLERTDRAGRHWVPGRDLIARLLTTWRRYLVARLYQARGFLVIFDRYIYDAILAPRQEGDWRGQLYWWLLGHACPPPDLIFLLDAPGNVLYARKHEHCPATLEEWRQQLLALREHQPRLEVIDASLPAAVVRVTVLSRIWQHYLARQRGR